MPNCDHVLWSFIYDQIKKYFPKSLHNEWHTTQKQMYYVLTHITINENKLGVSYYFTIILVQSNSVSAVREHVNYQEGAVNGQLAHFKVQKE